MPYAIYFSGSALYIHENNDNRGRVATGLQANQWYDVKIELKPLQGAVYWYRKEAAADWMRRHVEDFRRGFEQAGLPIETVVG